MATIAGSVRVAGFIAPSDTTDTYAVTDDTYNRGGYKSVADETARLAITTDRRKLGMLVRQNSDDTYWTLKGGITNSDWLLESFSGGGGGITPTDGILDWQSDSYELYPNKAAADDSAGFYDMGDSAPIPNTELPDGFGKNIATRGNLIASQFGAILSFGIIDTLDPTETRIMDLNPTLNSPDSIGYSFGLKNNLSGSNNKHSVWKDHEDTVLMSLNNYGSVAINSTEGEGYALTITTQNNDRALSIEANNCVGIKLDMAGSFSNAIVINSSFGDFIRCRDLSDYSKFNVDKDGNVDIAGSYKVNGAIIPSILRTTATLSSAEILAGTIKTVLSAPGVGKYINIISANLIYKFGTVAYGAGYYASLDYEISLTNRSYFYGTAALDTQSFNLNLLDWASLNEAGTTFSEVENKGLYLGIVNTPTVGDGTLKCDILYTIENY